MPIKSVASNDSTAGNVSPMATLTIRNLDAIGLKLINPWDLDGIQT